MLIGLKAILQDSIPLVGLCFLAFVIWLIGRSEQKWWRSGGMWVLLAVFLFGGYLYVTSIAASLRGYYFLRTLQAGDIESILVDGTTVSEDSAKRDLSSAFHHVQWFSSSHGGWAKEIPFHIRLRNGKERTFSIALYLRRPGVVIQSTSHTSWSYRTYDCGFSTELPEVFASMKITLPKS